MIEITEKQIKSAKLKFIFAAICFVLAFASIIMSAIFDDGPYEFLCPVGLILFFIFMIISLVLLFSGFPDFAAHDMWKLQNKYKEKMLNEIKFESKSQIESIFKKNKFRNINSICWTRNKFHFFKDTIRYYIKFAELNSNKCKNKITENSFSEIIEKETDLFEKENYDNENSVLLLFIEFNELNNEELKEIKKVCESYLEIETVYMACVEGGLIPVIINNSNNKMYFFDESKGLTYYAYGCRMLKRIFS